VVVLVTGDADFAALALQLRRRGIRVESASLAQTLGAGLKTAVNEAIEFRGGGGEAQRSVGGRAPPLLATFESRA
jgi:uncharacterized LabA/DUF88 family protein